MNILLTLVLFLFVISSPALADDNQSKSSGVADYTTKILGGTQANPGDWPWMAALLQAGVSDTYQAQYCSGVLIDDNWVLTAAHCAEGRLPRSIQVAVGAYDLSSYSGSRIPVNRIIIHPGYNSDTQNDIALLELSQPSSQPKIVLFSGESNEDAPADLVGRMLTAIGWGMADGGSNTWYYPEILRQVDLPVVDDGYCNNIYSTPLIASQLCAGYYEGKDVCNGDSGGPVVTEIDGDWVHAGLVSYGTACDQYNGWYGVYTRTSAFVDFIKGYVPKAQFTQKEAPGQQPKTITPLWLLLLTH